MDNRVYCIVKAGLCFFLLSLFVISCNQKSKNSATENSLEATSSIQVTLFDKTLPEIQEYVHGKWELLSGQNGNMFFEYENTFIEFNGDEYVWTEDGESERGLLNWRKEETGNGYESYLMDVFYDTNPAYILALKNDTLMVQDCTETAYRYKLVRRK